MNEPRQPRPGAPSEGPGTERAATPKAELFLRACRGESVSHLPVWMMRQAGRYLPEYRELRAKHDFLDLCKTPELAAEVTLQPVRRLGVDAAILFSDILVPIEPMGIGLRFDPGPILDRPINSEEAIAGLRPVEAEESCGFVMDAIRLLRRELEGSVPLIGFCGAPFTVAAYLVEDRAGRSAKGTFDAVVRLIYERPDLARRLFAHLRDVMAGYLSAQIRAGAQAVQIFESWGGILGPREFSEFVLPYVKELIERLPAERGPVIYFCLNGGHLLSQLAHCGADVIGVDWRTPLSEARRILGETGPAAGPSALQGNLDPRALFAPRERLAQEVQRIVGQGLADAGAPGPVGHVFNLGHGILPETPLESAAALVELVHHSSALLYRASVRGEA